MKGILKTIGILTVLFILVAGAAWMLTRSTNKATKLELFFGRHVMTSSTTDSPFPVESVTVDMNYERAQARASRLMKTDASHGTSFVAMGKMFAGTPFEIGGNQTMKFDLFDDSGGINSTILVARINDEVSACVVWGGGGTSIVQRIAIPFPATRPGAGPPPPMVISTNFYPSLTGRSSMSGSGMAGRHFTVNDDLETVREIILKQHDLSTAGRDGFSTLSTNALTGAILFPESILNGKSVVGLSLIETNEVTFMFIVPRSKTAGTHIFVGKIR